MIYVRSGLNSLYFHMIGDGHQPNFVGVYRAPLQPNFVGVYRAPLQGFPIHQFHPEKYRK